MTPQEWLATELQKPFYDGWSVEQIHAYLNAPKVTETPNPNPQEDVTVVLPVQDLAPLVTPQEWIGIRSSTTPWSEVSDAAIATGDQAAILAAMTVDMALLAALGPGAITLVQAVAAILQAEDPELAHTLITVLVAAGKLSQESAQAIQAAMVQPDPDWQPVLYSVSPSVWETATGLTRPVTIEEIQEVLQ